MTFTTRLKEEIAKLEINYLEDTYELKAFFNCLAKISDNEILITVENAKVARRIYKEIKEIYKVNPNIIINSASDKVNHVSILSKDANVVLIIVSIIFPL